MNYFNSAIFLLTDPLSLFFLLVISLVAVPSGIYSLGYLKGQYPARKIILGWVLFLVFILSMAFVVTVNNAFIFLVFWEIMSLVSYFLVIFDTDHEKSVQAGVIYIIMTHIGTAFITVAFFLMFKYAHSFDFTAIKLAAVTMPAGVKNIIFILLLLGFGTKAGIVPLHIWLPYAHPQAPSHISSLMSGVMIKTAVYGLLRYVVFIIGIDSIWWAKLVLVLAMLSCLVGIMYALIENDLKKLLAYSSVENMGIILLGVGAAMFFIKMNIPDLAVLALAAGLYHLINHAVFKGLLFLCAGSVYKATGTRDIEKLGGLIKLMPVTAVCFLIGSLAISAMPPLNGFISEWLILQSFFLGALNTVGGNRIFMGLCASVLALTGGLAAACFVKAFGVTMLALPRSQRAKDARESSASMRLSMIAMSVFAGILGLAAPVVLRYLITVSGFVTGIQVEGMNFTLNNFVITVPYANQVYLSSSYIGLVLASVFLIVLAVSYFKFGKPKVSVGKTWDCGYYKLTSRNEYTATAFSKPFRIAFNFFLLPYKRTQKIRDSFYHVKSFKYEVFTTSIFKHYIYEPLLRLIFGMARLTRKIQPGSIHVYIAYIFITIVTLIIFVEKF